VEYRLHFTNLLGKLDLSTKAPPNLIWPLKLTEELTEKKRIMDNIKKGVMYHKPNCYTVLFQTNKLPKPLLQKKLHSI